MFDSGINKYEALSEDTNLTMDDKTASISQEIGRNNETVTSDTGKVSIINLSNTQIDQVTLGLLERGLNFSISPRTIPKEDILCSIGYGI